MANVSIPLATRLVLRALAELEDRNLLDAARVGHRRLWASLPADAVAARLQVAHALLRLGLASPAPEILDEACAVWRSLGVLARAGEARARTVAIGLVVGSLRAGRVAPAVAVAAAEAERAPGHDLALYARGRLALLEGDTAAAGRLLERAARGADARVAERARALVVTLPDERPPRPGEALPAQIPIAARLSVARRLSRSAGRYARVRGLDLLLDLVEPAPADVLQAASIHVDVVGVRLTEIERDRLREIARRLPASDADADAVARLAGAVDLRANLSALSPIERVDWLAQQGPAALAPLAQAVRRGVGPWPESHDPAVALAAEALRVVDALRAGSAASFDRLASLFEAAGPAAALVPTLWALFPPFVARHGELGLAAERLRPILAAVLERGPARSLDPAVLARALDALGEDDLAERAAARAAEEGSPGPQVDRLVRRAFRLQATQPEEALRLLERAERMA